jgi:lipid II:glycine glycyltransferase (peptidoglycan interpeptide bridge formation enzyme)
LLEQREQWDAFVFNAPGGHLLQSWGWGELKAHVGWFPLRLALWSGEEIVAGAAVLRRTAPHFPLHAGHLAYIPKGPVLDWSDSAVCDAFFPQLTAYLRKQGAIAMRIEPGEDVLRAGAVLKRLDEMQMRSVVPVQPLRTIILDLTPSEDMLLAQMKEKWRYNVRLAARRGVTVRVAETADDVRSWYRLLQTTGERDHFGIHSYDYYLDAWRIFAERNEARLLLAEYEGQLLAGIFVGLFARQGIYLYGASGNEQRQLMPNYLLQWEAIRWAKRQGALTYDFWGIPATDAEDEAMAGVYRFKSGWGGRVVQFPGCYEAVYRHITMNIARATFMRGG